MNFVKSFLVFSLSMFLLSCSNNVEKLDHVEELNKRLVELSQLSIDECWNELVKPIEIEPNRIDELVEMDYLKYRVGMITLESFSQLTSRIVQKDSIRIPHISNLPNQPDLKRLTEYREADKVYDWTIDSNFRWRVRSSEIKDESCSVSKVGFHMESTIAIKFNSDGRFNYSDMLSNQPKSFWGTWKQDGNQIITTNDRSTNGRGIGQVNTYTYDCNKLTIGGFTLVKD